MGDGFHVYPVFANLAFKTDLSPFLMFDYAAPKKFPVVSGGKRPPGVGQHPHRGFETVTIAFKGEVEHADSIGNRDVIKEGDIQWMTAGRGIIHQEFHSNEFAKRGGTFEMCQLWVNLPRKYKMVQPRYQPINGGDVPIVSLPLGCTEESKQLGTLRVIAGSIDEVKGPAMTYSPVELWDVKLKDGGKDVDLPFLEGHNCIVFVRRGGVDIISGGSHNGGKTEKVESVGPQAVALMKRNSGGMLRLRAKEPNTSLLIMGGEPIDEPIAARGPFVMNTWDEILQANEDYRIGRMGK